jgi:hypothetical protein
MTQRRQSELLNQAAAAMEDGRDPFDLAFLCEHDVTLDECYDMAEWLAIGARIVAWAIDNPRQAAHFASSGTNGMMLDIITETLSKIDLIIPRNGPEKVDN